MQSFFRYTAISTLISILGISTVLAQGAPTGVVGLELTASSDNPIPGQTVTINAESYSIDMDSSSITWVSGGKTIAKGIGVIKATVQAPALGQHVDVTVTATSPGGTTFSNSITIGSGSIDLIVEPAGYTPPFFLGKNAVTYQNDVKIVAVPHLANSSGVEYDPKTLVYSWNQDGSVLPDQSGYGMQSITLPGNIVPRPYTITVTVSTRDSSAQGQGLVSIAAGAPSISFYADDPLYGPLYNKELGDNVYVGSQRELDVLAVPYGFDAPATGLGNLSLTWLINGTEHPELASNEAVTLRAPEGAAGSSNIQLNMTNSQDILQQASAAFSAIFSADSTANAQQSVTF